MAAVYKSHYLVDSNGRPYFTPGLVLPNSADAGILVGSDTSSDYPYDDVFGMFTHDPGGAAAPTFKAIRTNVYGFQYGINDAFNVLTHFTHRGRYATGCHAYTHVHWTHNGTSISGSLVLAWFFSVAKGHSQGVYPAAISATQTIATANITDRPQYGHFIDEFQASADSPDASQFNSNLLEPDTILRAYVTVTTLPTLGGGGELFIDFADVHAKHCFGGTKNKAPNFHT